MKTDCSCAYNYHDVNDSYSFIFSSSSGVADSSDDEASIGLQYMSHHPERQSLVVRIAESIFSLLRPRMYFAVILMAAGL